MSTELQALLALQADDVVIHGLDERLSALEPRIRELDARKARITDAIARSAAAETKLVEGDARLRLREAADGGYDLLVLDAFSSDAIPVHLITREALELYLRKLAPGGLLAFHISNRYLDLEPVLGNLAQELRLVALGCDDMSLTEAEFATGREQSHWVVMARTAEGLAGFQRRTRWSPLETNPRVGVWMDDFSSPVKVWQR